MPNPKELLRAKLLRFCDARFSGDHYKAAMAGLSGADPKHDAQWWLDNLDRRMRREGWNDKPQPHVAGMSDPHDTNQDGGAWEPWLFDLWGPASTGRIARNDAIRRQEASLRRSEDWRARQASMGIRTGPAKMLAAVEGVFSKERMRRGREELGLEPPRLPIGELAIDDGYPV